MVASVHGAKDKRQYETLYPIPGEKPDLHQPEQQKMNITSNKATTLQKYTKNKESKPKSEGADPFFCRCGALRPPPPHSLPEYFHQQKNTLNLLIKSYFLLIDTPLGGKH